MRPVLWSSKIFKKKVCLGQGSHEKLEHHIGKKTILSKIYCGKYAATKLNYSEDFFSLTTRFKQFALWSLRNNCGWFRFIFVLVICKIPFWTEFLQKINTAGLMKVQTLGPKVYSSIQKKSLNNKWFHFICFSLSWMRIISKSLYLPG